MKKKLYLSMCIIFALLCSAVRSQAQYHITTHGLINNYDSICVSPQFYVNTNAYTATLSVTTYFGDGTSASNPVYNGSGSGYANFTHAYTPAGTYTVKHVLYNGTTAVDSVVESDEYLYCNTFIVKAFNDLNNNCVFDSSTENYVTIPMTIEVDSSSVPIDTLITTSGLYYVVSGAPGTVYTFKVLSTSPGVTVSCLSGAIIKDTVQPIVNGYVVKDFPVTCTAATGFDLGAYAETISGRHHAELSIVVNNGYCSPENATLTMHFSPKYNFTSAVPAPASVVGNTVTWSFTGVTAANPKFVSVDLDVPSTWLTPGDTIQYSFVVTPTTGDINPANNSCTIVDSVTGSFDPNEKSVTPRGYIHAGTKLTYTVNFENTGNDTAFNIHVMDTLSANVDPKSLAIVTASAPMNLSVYTDGGYNIAKFDFPHIDLLDSTHHNQNTGMFVYSINAKAGLPNGTVINNEAGIYFDYNPVVMTNNVQNVIGTPAGVTVMGNVANVEVYPNPVSDQLTVQVDNSIYSKATITNIMGQQIITAELTGTTTQLNVKALPAGTYFITLRGESGVKVQQFQKM